MSFIRHVYGGGQFHLVRKPEGVLESQAGSKSLAKPVNASRPVQPPQVPQQKARSTLEQDGHSQLPAEARSQSEYYMVLTLSI